LAHQNTFHISGIFKYFASLGKEGQKQVVELLIAMMESPSTGFRQAESEVTSNRVVACCACGSSHVRANGKLKGVQRYWCGDCGKHFSEAVHEGFEGITESDDIFFLHSEKGSRNLQRKPRKRGSGASKRGISDEQVDVVATCDRKGNKEMVVTARGRISKKDLDRVLGGKLEKTETLCTDCHRSYTAFAKGKGLAHKKFNASKGQRITDKAYHVQNVNNTARRLRQWMGPFNGVSTRYLQNYLNWFMVLDKIKNSNERLNQFALYACMAANAWNTWRTVVNSYGI
jgi:transposase-like protein